MRDTYVTRTVLVLSILMLIGACGLLPKRQYEKRLRFLVPPRVGETIFASARDFNLCDSRRTARYLSATGFTIDGCTRFNSAATYIVIHREFEELRDGGVWLLQVEGSDGISWVPIPWHEWA